MEDTTTPVRQPRLVLTVPLSDTLGNTYGAVTVTLDAEQRWYTVADNGMFRMKSTSEAHAFTAAFEAAGWGVRVTKRHD